MIATASLRSSFQRCSLYVNNRKRLLLRCATIKTVGSIEPSSYSDWKLHCNENRHLRWHSTSKDRPFHKILIANRGEIACRVMRTCQKLGIETVAIYSNADGPSSLHAQMANESYKIGTGPSATESYLLGDEVIQIAKESGAQAIHPGYGFLSENANFVQSVTDASIKFVGPSPDAVIKMGSKDISKKIMEDAGVPTTPGYHGLNQDPKFLLEEAKNNVGFPLLIKAVMGGGGKGMRLVENEHQFLEALESCKRESKSSFGNDAVLLEKYLIDPRHIEIQIISDNYGNTVHLFERDCSLQRRHQKIIEEAPGAFDLPDDVRSKLHEMGVKAAQAVNYVNAGTIEFLLDTKSKDNEFYFCEMNTRLQVEHPISEEITGIDLVEWQLRVASGQELPITNQNDIKCKGHSLEARIYAENTSNNLFLPATGNVWHLQPPATPNVGTEDGVRVDTGIQPNQDIGVYYDPMISKLIVHGNNRMDAINRLTSALKKYHIAGVPNNIDFLIKCLNHTTFQKAGAVNTGFLDKYTIEDNQKSLPPLFIAICAFAMMLKIENRVGVENLMGSRRQDDRGPWSQYQGSWRAGGLDGRMKRSLNIVIDNDANEDGVDASSTLECMSNHDGSFEIFVTEGESFIIDGTLDNNNCMKIQINGIKQMKDLSVAIKDDDNDGTTKVHVWNNTTNDEEYAWDVSFINPLKSLSTTSRGSSSFGDHHHGSLIKAPMPGKIVRINVSVGDAVQKDDVIMILEAMKMEHSITANKSGVIAEIVNKVHDIVQDGSLLASIDDDEVAGEAA